MVPLPFPVFVTLSRCCTLLKMAVTFLASSMVTVQVPVPLQAPVHPAKEDPASGVAVKETTWPLEYEFVQPVPQLIPAGVLTIVPFPVPVLLTVNLLLKLAWTVLDEFMVTLHAPTPVQAPLQPEKSYPLAGLAVNVTIVPLTNDSLQSNPQ